ncbi:MAG: cyclomaltodextrinase C-terminal domain-containing protein, partial [Pseudomonadota bacterium]|nr:cyclomaltodextrinase C-terminal domain-containing protein [Pseudomonadota bacterium]
QQRIKALLQLRQSHPSQFKGLLKHYAPENGVYTYIRETDKSEVGTAAKANTTQSDKIMVILNKKAVKLSLSKYAEVLSNNQTLTRLSDGKSFKASETLNLPAMSASVFIVQ